MTRPPVRFSRSLALAGLLAAASVPGCGGSDKPAAPKGPVVQEVIYGLPVEEEVVDYEEFTGRTDAVMTADVRARVTGYLDRVDFEDGAEVEKDVRLFEIDPRPYKTALEKARATQAQAEAALTRSEADYNRYRTLISRG